MYYCLLHYYNINLYAKFLLAPDVCETAQLRYVKFSKQLVACSLGSSRTIERLFPWSKTSVNNLGLFVFDYGNNVLFTRCY